MRRFCLRGVLGHVFSGAADRTRDAFFLSTGFRFTYWAEGAAGRAREDFFYLRGSGSRKGRGGGSKLGAFFFTGGTGSRNGREHLVYLGRHFFVCGVQGRVMGGNIWSDSRCFRFARFSGSSCKERGGGLTLGGVLIVFGVMVRIPGICLTWQDLPVYGIWGYVTVG